MRKKLPIRLFGLLALLCIPRLAFCCFEYNSFTATASGDQCSVNLAWSFNECGIAGTYYIEYSANNSPFNIIGSVSTPGINTGPDVLAYTDSYAHSPGSGSNTTSVEYRIVFVSGSSFSTYYSRVTFLSLGASSCTNNNVSRCNSLPSNLNISGPIVLCPPATGNYSLSSAIPTVWTISNSSFATLNVTDLGGGSSVTNSSTNEQTVTLATNVYGCLTLTKVIALGPQTAADIIGMDPNVIIPGGSTIGLSVNEQADDYTWSVDGGTILSGQDQSSISVLVDQCDPSQQAYNIFDAHVSLQNTCGTGNTFTKTAYVQCNGGIVPQTSKSTLFMGSADLFENNTASRFSIFPNPAKRTVHISLSPDSIDITHAIMRLMDILGHPLKKISNLSSINSIDISNLASGIYIIEISDGKKRIVKKLVKNL
jgi:hypothetical protein